MSAVDVQAAYRHCEGVTRSRARNFYYGIRLLPPAKRGALSAVYAFARRVDDIGDGALEPQDKLDRLATARAELAQLDHHHDPVLVALDDASQKFPLPLKAFGELIEGVEMDVRGTSYPTFDDLAHYCRCVAGSIGRLSLGVFGSSELLGRIARRPEAVLRERVSLTTWQKARIAASSLLWRTR